MAKWVFRALAAVVSLLLVGWLGLQIKPRPFAPYPELQPELETFTVPADLPAPVARFYQTLYGGEAPVVTSAVIRAEPASSPSGSPFPAVSVSSTTPGRAIATTSRRPSSASPS